MPLVQKIVSKALLDLIDSTKILHRTTVCLYQVHRLVVDTLYQTPIDIRPEDCYSLYSMNKQLEASEILQNYGYQMNVTLKTVFDQNM